MVNQSREDPLPHQGEVEWLYCARCAEEMLHDPPVRCRSCGAEFNINVGGIFWLHSGDPHEPMGPADLTADKATDGGYVPFSPEPNLPGTLASRRARLVSLLAAIDELPEDARYDQDDPNDLPERAAARRQEIIQFIEAIDRILRAQEARLKQIPSDESSDVPSDVLNRSGSA